MTEADLRAAKDVEDHEQVEEFVPEVITRMGVKRPNKAEIERHEITHLPFKSWCDVCVSGRGLVQSHKTSARQSLVEESRIGIVSFDWAHLKDRNSDTLVYMLVGIDRRTSRRFAVITNNKLSNNAHTIRQALMFIKTLGVSRSSGIGF